MDTNTTSVTKGIDINEYIHDRIIQVLLAYPIISPGMLQVGIGNSISPKIWRPILQQMIDDEVINRREVVVRTLDSRHRSYTKLSLKGYNKSNPQL